MDILRSAAESKTKEVQESKQTAEILVNQVNEEKAIAEEELSAAEVILKEAEEAVKVNTMRPTMIYFIQYGLRVAVHLLDLFRWVELDVDQRLTGDLFSVDAVDRLTGKVDLVIHTSDDLCLHTSDFHSIENDVLCQGHIFSREHG